MIKQELQVQREQDLKNYRMRAERTGRNMGGHLNNKRSGRFDLPPRPKVKQATARGMTTNLLTQSY